MQRCFRFIVLVLMFLGCSEQPTGGAGSGTPIPAPDIGGGPADVPALDIQPGPDTGGVDIVPTDIGGVDVAPTDSAALDLPAVDITPTDTGGDPDGGNAQDDGGVPVDLGGQDIQLPDGGCLPNCPQGVCQPDGCDGLCPACATLPKPYGTQCKISGSPDPPAAMKLELAFPNLLFNRPVDARHAGDGSNRLFVVQKQGKILVFPNKPNAKVSDVDVFLDITSKVNAGPNEAGLLSIAFHPSYLENGYFYVNYTRSKSGKLQTYVSRFSVSATNSNKANPASEFGLMAINQPFSNHNGGQIAFGLDGYLYIGMGDGGAGGDPLNSGQDLQSLLAKMLRIDIDNVPSNKTYGIPADNPFASGGGGKKEIWAWGLRNPWRFSFDSVTGQLWTGDVGQDKWEEVDIVEGGKNYGWRIMEGNHCFKPSSNCDDTGLTPPVTEYNHAVGESVTGGFVYRGTKYPGLFGAYVYGDYESGIILAARFEADEAVKVTTLAKTNVSMSAFGEDELGELLVVDYPYWQPKSAQLFRLVPQAPSQSQSSFPLKLSETGCFSNLATMTPAEGLVPYSVTAPLWHDGAGSERYLALPAGGKLVTKTPGAWELPVGTRLIKTFVFDQANGTKLRVETRFEIHEPGGWTYYTYRWKEDQSDAILLSGAAEWEYKLDGKPLVWHFPSRSQCASCHSKASGRVLGWHTGLINKDWKLGNQLFVLQQLGVLQNTPDGGIKYPDPADVTAGLDERVRAALFVNCAGCHMPGGTSTTDFDLRFETPLSQTKTCNVAPDKGSLGVANSKLIAPGAPDKSIMVLRMKVLDDFRMPNFGSFVVDTATTGLIDQWIGQLSGCQ